MSVSNLISTLGAGEVLGRCGIVMLIVFTILQIAPIKINPWSWIGGLFSRFFGRLGHRVGKAINGEVMTKLGTIHDRLSELEEHDRRQDMTRAKDKALDARRRILRFADEVRREEKHSEEHFRNVFEDIKYYNTYCDNHHEFENDRARISIGIIRDVYEKCVRENSFL